MLIDVNFQIFLFCFFISENRIRRPLATNFSWSGSQNFVTFYFYLYMLFKIGINCWKNIQDAVGLSGIKYCYILRYDAALGFNYSKTQPLQVFSHIAVQAQVFCFVFFLQ